VQADERRVKKQGGIVWMALAMMIKTRLWLGGEVSAQRALPLIRRLLARVSRCAAHRPLLVCTDGSVSYSRAVRETFLTSRGTCDTEKKMCFIFPSCFTFSSCPRDV
jgi:hypothetical protein